MSTTVDPVIIGLYCSTIMLRQIMRDISFEADTLAIDMRMMTLKTNQLFAENGKPKI